MIIAESAKAWVRCIRWKPTSSGNAEPYARQKMMARTGGEKGRHLCFYGLSRRRPLRVNLLESESDNKIYMYHAVHNKKSHDEYPISPPSTITSSTDSQRADAQYEPNPRKNSRQFSLSQIPPAGVPSMPVPTDLSPHSHQVQLRLREKNTSKLRAALECIPSRAITIPNM